LPRLDRGGIVRPMAYTVDLDTFHGPLDLLARRTRLACGRHVAGRQLFQDSRPRLGRRPGVELRLCQLVEPQLPFPHLRTLAADPIIVSAGIRPRDELARAAGLGVGPRGGIVVDDALNTTDPRVHAVGECALHRGQIYGLVAPGYAMAEVPARPPGGGPPAAFPGADPALAS